MKGGGGRATKEGGAGICEPLRHSERGRAGIHRYRHDAGIVDGGERHAPEANPIGTVGYTGRYCGSGVFSCVGRGQLYYRARTAREWWNVDALTTEQIEYCMMLRRQACSEKEGVGWERSRGNQWVLWMNEKKKLSVSSLESKRMR